ncbi:MAG: YggS family pyridoxal phosphate-dependent enzyme [Pyrinomonadaceae bacterium]
MHADIIANLQYVRERIAQASARAGRDAETVRLVAVSKTHPAESVGTAIAAGVAAFGENKIQEAEGKIALLGPTSAEWHLIGHLQSNKARRAVQLFDVIQSVDSVDLATRLERLCVEEGRPNLSVFAQVDLAGETTKSGISEADLPELAVYLGDCKHLRFDGLMVLPPYADDPDTSRPYFVRLRNLRDQLAADDAFAEGGCGDLSMGMSHDFEAAIEEGATVVRVGTAIFGEREYKG